MSGQFITYGSLALAILCETVATSFLKESQQFTRLLPSVVVVVTGYACAFYFLSVTLKTLPVGIAYALWSGLGIVLIALLAFGQRLDAPAWIGIALIIAGVGGDQRFFQLGRALSDGRRADRHAV